MEKSFWKAQITNISAARNTSGKVTMPARLAVSA
jgi:hypothetical protein